MIADVIDVASWDVSSFRARLSDDAADAGSRAVVACGADESP
ncbi:hypothetical protein [Methylobacterium aquaticum]|nr:hypothetical protein [Methylobacterium aquaticum]